MATAYINETIEIPNVTSQTQSYERIGDRDYTALGTYRSDDITRKEVWRIEAQYLTNTEYNAIKSVVKSNGADKFWLDEFGGSPSTDSIQADFTISNDERVSFAKDDGSWENKGHTIELEIRER